DPDQTNIAWSSRPWGKKNKNTQIVPANCPVADIDPKTTFCIQHTTSLTATSAPMSCSSEVLYILLDPGSARMEGFIETVVHEIENALDALVSMFKSDNMGKMLVKVAEEESESRFLDLQS
ncbi:hypothetical protein BG006_009599, partial [Podila minutissima]